MSRGKERFVNEIHRHNPEIVNDRSLLRTKEENFDNVSFESVKPASGNRGYGSEDSDTAKWNGQTFNWASKNCNIHGICYILDELQFHCAFTLLKERDPKGGQNWRNDPWMPEMQRQFHRDSHLQMCHKYGSTP